jgi:hypothetical protein
MAGVCGLLSAVPAQPDAAPAQPDAAPPPPEIVFDVPLGSPDDLLRHTVDARGRMMRSIRANSGPMTTAATP